MFFFKASKIIIILLCLNLVPAFADEIIEVNFDDAMGKQCQQNFQRFCRNQESIDRYNKFKAIYNNNLPSNITAAKDPIIPQIIHQIWLGGKPLPKLYKKYQQQWQFMYYDWQYILWTEKEIEQFDFPSKKLYEQAKTYQEKADILRYEILNKYGGIYADFDVEPKKLLTPLTYKYQFFAGLEPAYKQQKITPVLNNGFIGATPNNPILKETLRLIKTHWQEWEKKIDLFKTKNGTYDLQLLAVSRTMLPLTDAFLSKYNKLQHVMPFPVTYTQPRQFKHVLSKHFTKKLYRKYFDNCEGDFTDIRPETLVFHNIAKENSLIEVSSLEERQYPSLTDNDKKYFSFFKQVLESSLPSNIEYNEENLIPNVLHYIVLDENDKKKINNWKKAYPAWRHRIWTKKEINSLVNDKSLLAISDKSLQKFIYGYFILAKLGGVIADLTINPPTVLEELNNKYSFYASLYSRHFKPNSILVNPSLIAAKAENIFLTETLKQVKSCYQENKFLLNEQDLTINCFIQPLTLAITNHYKEEKERFIIFPSDFFTD